MNDWLQTVFPSPCQIESIHVGAVQVLVKPAVRLKKIQNPVWGSRTTC